MSLLPFSFSCTPPPIQAAAGPTKNLLADVAQEVASERDVAFAVR
jgi:hypothetical protein